MLEHTDFPYLPPGNASHGIAVLTQLCRELPPDGEQFRFFRRRMKGFRLWDDDRVQGTLDFLGITRAGTVKPSRFVKSIRTQKRDEKVRAMLADRLWEINPLLFKTIIEQLKEQVHSRDEVIKHISGFAYPGKKPTRPNLESWLHMALGLELLKMVGIALDIGPNCERFLERARALDVEEFLEDAAAEEQAAAAEVAEEPAESDEVAEQPAPAAATPASANAPAAAPAARTALPPPFAGGVDLPTPRGRQRPVNPSRFAGQRIFTDEVLDETTSWVQAWWAEQSAKPRGPVADDFNLDANAWMEGAEEALYRTAVASALVFRLGRDRDSVIQAYEGLDKAGVLADLYYGTAPDELPENVDPKALMLASLVARRCAEAPELASTLDKQESAEAAFAVLDNALGRGFLRIELFWLMRALADMGAARFQDLPGFTALPRRLVRDTLFRLGYIDTPYAHDAASLIPGARAARRAAGTAEPPDEVLISFALAAGCAYDCGHRRKCEFACRERAE